MALTLRQSLARALARVTGESVTGAVIAALRERLEQKQPKRKSVDIVPEIMEISCRCAALPILDQRGPDELLGYDERGLPR